MTGAYLNCPHCYNNSPLGALSCVHCGHVFIIEPIHFANAELRRTRFGTFQAALIMDGDNIVGDFAVTPADAFWELSQRLEALGQELIVDMIRQRQDTVMSEPKIPPPPILGDRRYSINEQEILAVIRRADGMLLGELVRVEAERRDAKPQDVRNRIIRQVLIMAATSQISLSMATGPKVSSVRQVDRIWLAVNP